MVDDRVDEAAVLRAGGREAFESLYRRHATTVLRYALRLTKGSAEAEELLQETFLTLWAKRRNVATTGGSLLPWLLVTCRHHGANLLRKRMRRGTESLELGHEPATPDHATEDFAWLDSAIAALSEVDRAIIARCLLDGVAYADAARELGLTTAAVAKRVQRIRQQLRRARDEN